jgi:hypothetical protein
LIYGLSPTDLTALSVLGWGSWKPLGGGAMIGEAMLSGISAGMAVPEPSAWIAMLLGFSLVGAMARRSASALAT